MKNIFNKRIKIFCVFVLMIILIIIGLKLYINYQMSQVPGMSYEEALKLTTENNEDAKITVGIIKDGIMEYTVYGNNASILKQHEYQYEIGSLTKTFTASLISKAIFEGKMNLEDPISNYISLPEKEYYPTLKRLVTHTSGLKAHYFDWQFINNFFKRQNNDLYGITMESMLNSISKADLEDIDYPWVYSNFGMSVAGNCVANIYEKNYRALMNEFVQTDLQMKDTRISDGTGDLTGYWQWKENDAYLPAGALISDISDMMYYCKLNMTEEISYLASTHEKLVEVENISDSYQNFGIRVDGMGMGWIIDEQDKIFWHNGGTGKFNSYMAFDKERQIGVVILSNLAPNYRIPATVMGIKLISELQKE
ncbi:MAG: serine hydrolase [Tissierellia bacterium]|nr:serine hydrolase [Tissierellia bacterium]MDD4780965.1 serine hydrolase [Tissierellia bacterium]